MGYSFANLDLLSVGIVCAGMGLLGFAIFFSDRKSVSNKAFFLFTLVSIFWGVANFFSYKLSEPLAALWILRAEIFLAVWHSFSLFLFILVFPERRHSFSKKFKFLLLPLTAVISVLTLTPIMFENISNFVGTGEVSTVSKGPATLFFILIVAFLLIGSFYNLIKKIRHAEAAEKKQLTTIFYGLLLTFFLIATFNFLLPALLNYLYLAPLGAVFIFPFIGFTFYAIYKYKLFNLRAAFVAGITFVLCVAAFLEIIFSTTLLLILLRSGVFLLVLAISIMMNRFVETIAEQEEQLAKANEGQVQLIHILNHQIKGYLAKGRNIFAELLEEPEYQPQTDGAKKMLAAGLQSLTEGVDFVQGVLNASSVEQGTLTYNMLPIDFRAIVAEAAEKQKPVAEEKGLKYEVNIPTDPMPATGDMLQLKEAVRNLIDNSIKYTPQGSIRISLEKIDKKYRLTIADTGVGLSEEDKPKLFTQGGRGKDSLKINTNSTGYGLSFVKGVIDAHHGKVWAESAGPHRGSSFFVELPISSIPL